jgi:NDP-sugar pyrophosphorylase family protein
MNAIIVCGGLSTRLGDITKHTPKILLNIGPKTVLDWQLIRLKRAGIESVVLAAGHLAEELQKTVGSQREGVSITYAVEPTRLGTGGAIKFALGFVSYREQPTIVLNGDILTTIDLVDMIGCLKPQTDGIILGSYVEDISSYGTLEYDDAYKLLSFKEKEGIKKPGYQNGGCYILNPQVKKYFPDRDAFSIEYDVFPNMKDLYVYESDRPWIDIGVPERLTWAREHWQQFEGGLVRTHS